MHFEGFWLKRAAIQCDIGSSFKSSLSGTHSSQSAAPPGGRKRGISFAPTLTLASATSKDDVIHGSDDDDDEDIESGRVRVQSLSPAQRLAVAGE